MLCRLLRRVFKHIQALLADGNNNNSAHSGDCQKVTLIRKRKKRVTMVQDQQNNGEILSLAINHDVHLEGTLYRLKRATSLRIIPGATTLGRHVVLYTNYPVENGAKFKRDSYYRLSWHQKNGDPIPYDKNECVNVTSTDIYCEIKVNVSGSFRFYFEYDSCKGTPQGSFYIQVEPIIRVGPATKSRVLPLDSVRCQTVMAKCLGPLDTWPQKLRIAKESGYNVIHFTPIQELGGSRSGYSLANQLKVNPQFSRSNATPVNYNDVQRVIQQCRQDWGIASICDIVLNHTANESEWLREHPESTYSCATCPHLRPAFLLDAVLAMASADTADGLLTTVGVPECIDQEHHVEALRHQLHSNYLSRARIWELYQIDVEAYAQKFNGDIRKGPPQSDKGGKPDDITVIQDPDFRRLRSTIDYERALGIFNVYRSDCFDEDTRLRRCSEEFRRHLEQLNGKVYHEIQNHLNAAVDNCLSGLRYERLQSDGPQIREISDRHPLFTRYFTDNKQKCTTIDEIEALMYGANGNFLMAHNGWVMNGDPLNDFARPAPDGRTGNVYIRRELIAWGDSVKLRFGDRPEDSPYLWDHMRKYVEMTAQIFDGVRLDNCHSTPFQVAEYMLDAARRINPELYVVAELFTNSDHTDNIFVNKLGITSLVREALSAWDSHEQGRLVYRYGGAPVGAFMSSPKRILAPNIAHAIFMDLTHDNPSPVQKRSVFDLMPSAALVAMACCATGSTRGYDELVPHHIHVVDEERQYQEWETHVNENTGIIAAKRALNLLHGQLAEQGFCQVYVDQMHPDIVAVTRHNPITHDSVILVAHTSFGYPDPRSGPTSVRPLRFEGQLKEIILEAQLSHKTGSSFDRPKEFVKKEEVINGVNEYKLSIKEHIPLAESSIFHNIADVDDNVTQLNFKDLKPGSVVAIRVTLKDEAKSHLKKLRALVEGFHLESGPAYTGLQQIVDQMNLNDLNKAMFQCEEEERDMGNQSGCYDIPRYGRLVYCGSQGFVSLLTEIAPNNDLGHPLCDNLRQGNWMIDYIHQRLNRFQGTKELANWLDEQMRPLKEIPRYLIPRYFDVIVNGIHNALKSKCFRLMSRFISNGSTFVQSLALGSVQCITKCESANLPPLSPATNDPKPEKLCPTLSAGLPHFSTGYMRCWGRDTFIAIRGLLYLCGRYDEARYMILGFGSTLRHGLIPNLLDGGYNARFNCRDAIWWWLYSIKLYVEEAPNGAEILKEKVSRLYPNDDSEAQPVGVADQPLFDVMQEALNIHFQGLVYRERNAGSRIDAHMRDQGFNNQIGVHPVTGFVFGGNAANCGTWMDKMGSSEKAGNRGNPTTPRDGSAVELVGLQMASLRFLEHISSTKVPVYPYKSVSRTLKGENADKIVWTFKEWADKIKSHFESNFFVDETVPNANKIHIYKDSVGATESWRDLQFRPNFTVAMVAAPELFDPKRAWQALEMAKKYLLGPLGMKTLEPEDWGYRGDYDNSNDSDDPTVAHGANYHQGPEWVWPIGFYLRARLIFAEKNGLLKETVAETWSILSAHWKELQTSHWRGLPELTNSNGAYCQDSCRTQAWSMATVLEVLYDLQNLPATNN